jgi:hypothetical protein
MTIPPEQIPKPAASGLTPEAEEALRQQGIPVEEGDTGSAAGNGIPEPQFDWDTPTFAGPEDGDIVDAELVDEPDEPRASRIRTSLASDKDRDTNRQAKSGPPDVDEWLGFFSRVVLKSTCNWYLEIAFRGIDEDRLSEREVARIAMTDDERAAIARPFAELSVKSKFMKKHGRMIVASGDSFYALVILGSWFSRVNRIASKYRAPKGPRSVPVSRVASNGNSGPGSQGGGIPQGANGGRIPDGPFTVYNPGGS